MEVKRELTALHGVTPDAVTELGWELEEHAALVGGAVIAAGGIVVGSGGEGAGLALEGASDDDGGAIGGHSVICVEDAVYNESVSQKYALCNLRLRCCSCSASAVACLPVLALALVLLTLDAVVMVDGCAGFL